MSAVEKLAEFEKRLPPHWAIADRAQALEEIERADGLIFCTIWKDSQSWITRFPAWLARRIASLT